MRRGFLLGLVGLASLCLPALAGARVLLVGTYHGIKGQYTSIEAAVDAAKANDWILVGPGDYKTTTSETVSGAGTHFPAGILLTEPGVYVRGMNRNTVIVDGTKSGPPCSRKKADQNFGPSINGGPGGLNGIMIWKANNVWVQNLTACNFLGGNGAAGNEIWWNGGANSGGATKASIGGHGYRGSYLTATNTFFMNEHTAAQYGIFSSNWSGGTWDQTYSSNFNDSGYYIGACAQKCDQIVNHAWGEFNALGYSGSNSGGLLIVKNSQFDHNEDGFDTNSQNGDNPPPQNGACPKGMKPPVKGAVGCWVFMDNYVHDNNNPNVPASGSAAAGPVGTGMSISGGRFDTIMHNRFVNNRAWGVIFVPYPDTSGSPCTGGVLAGAVCTYDDWGNALMDNMFSHNGGYGNPSNGDFAEITTYPGHPINCFLKNLDLSGKLTSSPSNLQQTNAHCGQTASKPDSNPVFTNQVVCDSQIVSGSPCVDANYPRRTKVIMHPLPHHLATMPNPCQGVPANPWCPARTHRTIARSFTG